MISYHIFTLFFIIISIPLQPIYTSEMPLLAAHTYPSILYGEGIAQQYLFNPQSIGEFDTISCMLGVCILDQGMPYTDSYVSAQQNIAENIIIYTRNKTLHILPPTNVPIIPTHDFYFVIGLGGMHNITLQGDCEYTTGLAPYNSVITANSFLLTLKQRARAFLHINTATLYTTCIENSVCVLTGSVLDIHTATILNESICDITKLQVNRLFINKRDHSKLYAVALREINATIGGDGSTNLQIQKEEFTKLLRLIQPETVFAEGIHTEIKAWGSEQIILKGKATAQVAKLYHNVRYNAEDCESKFAAVGIQNQAKAFVWVTKKLNQRFSPQIPLDSLPLYVVKGNPCVITWPPFGQYTHIKK